MHSTLDRIQEARIDANGRLHYRGIWHYVDEIGVKFDSADESKKFIEEMLHEGMQHFNSSNTTIKLVNDHGTVEFGLRLDFLRFPESTWRIEVMYVTKGPAPLHDGLPNGFIVHTAFKVPWDTFDKVCEQLPMPHGICTNDYGKFGYFGNLPYLKPRTVQDG